MRIAYVFDPLMPHRDTDAEQAINTICAMSRVGADVELFLPRHLLRPGVPVERLLEFYKMSTPFSVTYLRSLFPSHRGIEKVAHAVRAAAHRRLRDFDVVYSRNASAVLGALAWGHRVVYETYRPWPTQHRVLAPLFRAAMGRPNFVGAVLHSGYAKRKYQEVGIDGAVMEVVHNGYEPSLFEPRLSREEARARIGLPSDRPIAVYSGRITLGKGLGVVLDIAERTPEVMFVLVGSERRGEVEERASGMANVAIFPWTTYDVLPQYLFAADILLLPPSLIGLEGAGDTVLPMKLFLYLAAGRAIFAPRAPDTAELLRHRANAYLVEPDNVAAASAGLRELAQEPGLIEELAAASLADSRSFTWDARAEKILGFIAARLGRRAG